MLDLRKGLATVEDFRLGRETSWLIVLDGIKAWDLGLSEGRVWAISYLDGVVGGLFFFLLFPQEKI